MRLTDGDREILAEQERDADPGPGEWTDADLLAFEEWHATLDPERPVVPTGDEGGGTDEYPF